MKMEYGLNKILDEIRNKGRLPINIPLPQLQANLLHCKMVIEHIMTEKCKGRCFTTDVSEYFNLIVVRVETALDSIEEEAMYTQMCKDFKDLFTECGIEINLAIFLGNVKEDDYFYNVNY